MEWLHLWSTIDMRSGYYLTKGPYSKRKGASDIKAQQILMFAAQFSWGTFEFIGLQATLRAKLTNI